MISKLISDVQFVIMIKVHPRFFFQCRDSLFIFSSQVPHHNFLSVHMISEVVPLGGPEVPLHPLMFPI